MLSDFKRSELGIHGLLPRSLAASAWFSKPPAFRSRFITSLDPPYPRATNACRIVSALGELP